MRYPFFVGQSNVERAHGVRQRKRNEKEKTKDMETYDESKRAQDHRGLQRGCPERSEETLEGVFKSLSGVSMKYALGYTRQTLKLLHNQ